MLAIIPIRYRYLVDCIHCEIFLKKKCNSENMAKNVAAKFPPDLELQCSVEWYIRSERATDLQASPSQTTAAGPPNEASGQIIIQHKNKEILKKTNRRRQK